MISYEQIKKSMEYAFVNAITPYIREERVLLEAVKWISNHLKPEDVFSTNKLLDWKGRYNEERKDIPRIIN